MRVHHSRALEPWNPPSSGVGKLYWMTAGRPGGGGLDRVFRGISLGIFRFTSVWVAHRLCANLLLLFAWPSSLALDVDGWIEWHGMEAWLARDVRAPGCVYLTLPENPSHSNDSPELHHNSLPASSSHCRVFLVAATQRKTSSQNIAFPCVNTNRAHPPPTPWPIKPSFAGPVFLCLTLNIASTITDVVQ
jgi:hypothetical protein